MVITIQDREHGIPLCHVRSIEGKHLITPIPTRAWAAGITEIRGKSLPVIDLTSKLNLRKDTPPSYNCLIILKINHFKFAILANSTKELIKIDKQQIQLSPTNLQGTKLIQGIAKLPNRNIVLLNPEGIIEANLRNDSMPFRKEIRVSVS